MEIVPFTSDPKNTITVSLGGNKLQLTTQWNERGFWTLDVARAADGTVIVAGLPLLLGQDILSSFPIGLGGFLVTDTGGNNVEAGSDDLGDRVIVTYFTPDELVVLAQTGFYL